MIGRPRLPGPIDFGAVKVVSWDVDGTLYSIGRMKSSLVCLLIRELVAGRSASAWRDLAALRRYRLAVETARSRGGDVVEVVSAADRRALLNAERRWYGQAIERAGPRPGVHDLLDWLAARRIPQVVLSDYDAAYKLEVLKLEHCFTSTYSGEQLGFVKPSPKLFLRIAADFRIEARELLHIGDRAGTDGVAAAAAGCQCLILGRDFGSFRALASRFRATTPEGTLRAQI